MHIFTYLIVGLIATFLWAWAEGTLVQKSQKRIIKKKKGKK